MPSQSRLQGYDLREKRIIGDLDVNGGNMNASVEK